MRTPRATLVLLLFVASCGGGSAAHLVAPNAPPSLRDAEGLLVVASETDRATLRLCLDGYGECAVVGPTPPNGASLVYALAAGRWCVMHVACEPEPGDIAEHDVPEDEVLCIDVTAQHIAYPGHVHFDRSDDAQMPCAGRATFLMHHEIDAELAASHAGMHAPRVTLAPPTPMHPR